MTWTKLSDDFYDKESINELSHEAFRLHVYALVWCNKQLTDGVVSLSRLRRLLPEINTESAIAECVDAGLWANAADGKLQIDWSDQEPAEAVRRRQQRNADDQALYRERRELHASGDHSKCTKNCPQKSSQRVSKGLTHSVSDGAPSRPLPSQGEGKGKRAADDGRAVASTPTKGMCGHVLIDDRHCQRGCSPEAVAA